MNQGLPILKSNYLHLLFCFHSNGFKNPTNPPQHNIFTSMAFDLFTYIGPLFTVILLHQAIFDMPLSM